MSSRGKAIGLALAAMLALAALAMTPAGAWGKYDSEIWVTELKGAGENAQTLKTKFGNLVCQSLDLFSFQTGLDTGGVYTSNHTTLLPTYTGCTLLGFKATVDTASCEYTLTPPTKTETTGPHAQLDIVPGGEAACAIIIEAEKGLCTIRVPQKTSVGVVDIMNEGSGSTREITIASTINAIDYEGTAGFCKGVGSDGTYEGQMTLKGFQEGKQVGIWVTNT